MVETNQANDKMLSRASKSKRYIDCVYLVFLFFYMACAALSFKMRSFINVGDASKVCLAVLSLIAIIRLVLLFFSARKKTVIPFLAVLFGAITVIFAPDAPVLPVVMLAVGGIGVSADYILAAGIAGNIVMIINNFCFYKFGEPMLFVLANQDRHFLLLGDDTFYVPKMNNYSSTDFAAHYFWIIAAFLWIRGKKITWGEIAALGALDVLVYSLTASKTTLLCILLLLAVAVYMKIRSYIIENRKKTERSDGSKDSSFILKTDNVVTEIIGFCCRYSYIIIGALLILLALSFTCSSPFFLKLNDELHWRLSLGHRGFIEHGIRLLNSDVKMYGMSASGDGYYNFLDCSYIGILVRNGILVLLFYLASMSVIQIKHKKFIYGVAILAVCAVSCIEEHHLSELPYNMFILLLFAELNADKKAEENTLVQTKEHRMLINGISYAFCAVFFVSSVLIYYPMYKSAKELDRLDNRATEIYSEVQENLDLMTGDGSWQLATSAMASNQYGDKMLPPDDFERVTGLKWSEANSDPKEHSYYSIYYDAQNPDSDLEPMFELLLTDEVKDLIGDGSAIIEYDVAAGTVYSVWYCEDSGCYAIENGRATDRVGRLKPNVDLIEGYSTGAAND